MSADVGIEPSFINWDIGGINEKDFEIVFIVGTGVEIGIKQNFLKISARVDNWPRLFCSVGYVF